MDRLGPVPRRRASPGRLALTSVLLVVFVSWGDVSGAEDPVPAPGPQVERAAEEDTSARGQVHAKGGEESEGTEKSGEEETEGAQEDDETDLTEIKQLNPLKVRWDAGLHIHGKWDYLHVKIAGDVQNDTAGYVNTESAEEFLGTAIESGVEWRRVRAYAEGRLFRHVEFKLRYDFTAGNPPNLKDAFLRIVHLPIPDVGLTAGRFKAPLGLDGFTGADDLAFMERSLLSEAFLPSRNTGLMLHGSLPERRIRWSFAVLQPEANNIDLSNTDNLGWSARFAYAFTRGKQASTLVHLGADFWRRNVSDSIQYATSPESHLAPFFVDTGDIPAETSDITVFESAVQKGRVTFESEFALAKVNHTGLDSLLFHGFYAQASWFLTGEKRPYRTDRGTFTRPYPKRSIRDGGTGAMELGFRFSRIDLDDQGFLGGTLNDWSVGFNWYPTYHLKVMFNGILADLKGAKPVGILQMRLQVAF